MTSNHAREILGSDAGTEVMDWAHDVIEAAREAYEDVEADQRDLKFQLADECTPGPIPVDRLLVAFSTEMLTFEPSVGVEVDRNIKALAEYVLFDFAVRLIEKTWEGMKHGEE